MDQRHLHQELTAWAGQNDLFLDSLKKRLKAAQSVDLIISFVMESGVQLLLDQLKGVTNLRILTGTYLNITQPWALRMLRNELPDTAQSDCSTIHAFPFIQKHGFFTMETPDRMK